MRDRSEQGGGHGTRSASGRPTGSSSEAAVWEVLEIREAVAALPEHFRQVLLLRYLLGLSEEEVAQALGIRVGTVKSRSARARKALMEVLVMTRNRDDFEEQNVGRAFAQVPEGIDPPADDELRARPRQHRRRRETPGAARRARPRLRLRWTVAAPRPHS